MRPHTWSATTIQFLTQPELRAFFRAICRKCYVHPAVIESYLAGSLLEMLQRLGEADPASPVQGFSAEEGRVLAFLRQALTPEEHRVR